jgi:outer membrane protein
VIRCDLSEAIGIGPQNAWPWVEWMQDMRAEFAGLDDSDIPEGYRRSNTQPMNSKQVLVSALVAGLMTATGVAQTASPAAPAAQPATAPAAPATAPVALPQPVATPARIAIIEFQEVAAATNEGQKAVLEIQKKYEPQKTKLDTLQAEIDADTKKLQNAAATMTDADKASLNNTINIKQKQLQRDADDAQTSYNAEAEEAVGKVAQKLGPVLIKYLQQNGFTMLLDNTGQPQQGGLTVLWAPGTDISDAVVEAYNKASGVAPPPPSAPSATRSTTRPAVPAAPKPAAPKQ